MKLKIIGICLFMSLASYGGHAQLVTTVAGQYRGSASDDGHALLEANFNNPHGITIDGKGIIYIADRWNHKIRRFDPVSQQVTTIAGTGRIGSRDGPGLEASFYSPWGLTADSAGNVYVADTKNNKIRKIDTTGYVTTIAGSGSPGVVDGQAFSARFLEPTGIAITPEGLIYVCDHLGHTIRAISTTGFVSTLAGKAVSPGRSDGVRTNATFYRPYLMHLDHDGNLLVADEWNHLIRKVTPAGVVTTIAGSGNLGSEDGPALQADFNYPWDVISDPDGNLYVMDGYNYVIRKIDTEGNVSTFVGLAGEDGANDGYGKDASFSGATAVTMDFQTRALYVGDAYNDLIRKISIVTGVSLGSEDVANGDTICVNQPVTFRAEPSGFLIYQYYIDDLLVFTSESQDYSTVFTSQGIKQVKVIATNPEGFEIESQTISLFVTEPPSTAFTVTPLEVNENSYRVQFEAQAQGTNYSWDFGDPLSGADNYSTLKNPIHSYTNYGSYDVKLTTGFSSCADSLTREGIVNFSSPIFISSNDIAQEDTLCIHSTVDFVAQPNAFENYEFFIGAQSVQNSASPNLSTTFSSIGNQSIRVIGSKTGESPSESLPFEFYVSAKPVADFSHEVIDNSFQGYTVKFRANVPGASQFVWTFGDSTNKQPNISFERDPEHTYLNYGIYDVKLLVSLGDQCSDSLVQNGLINFSETSSNLFVPNAFTPNDDGLNDILYLRGKNIVEMELMIFNEWGELIFRSTDIGQGWDGRRNGKLVQPDTYVYIARAVISDGSQKVLKGQTTVLR